MNEHPARRPVRLEDLLDGLAWPVLLRLAGMSLRWTRLIVAWAAGVALVLAWKWRPPAIQEIWLWLLALRPAIPSQPGVPEAVPTASAPAAPSGSFLERLDALGWGQALLGVAAGAGTLALIGLTMAMLARSTALEVSRGLEVSPRYMLGWAARHPGSGVLWLWWVPFALVLGLLPLALIWAWRGADHEPTRAALMMVLGPVGLVWLLGSAFAALSSSLVWGAAACDIGDGVDRIQRTMAIAMAKPVRLALCLAWVAAIAAGLAWAVASINAALLWLVGQIAGMPEHAAVTQWGSLPLRALAVGVALSACGSGVTLVWLYLRRVADQQDYSEVPVSG